MSENLVKLYEDLKEAIGAKNAIGVLAVASGMGLSVLGITVLLLQNQQPQIIIQNNIE